MAYKHGVSATITASADIAVSNLKQFAPVYIGTAPLNQIGLVGAALLLNVPTVITGYNDFVSKFGWSDDWAKFTLCEAVYAHFQNPYGAIGPIIVICVSDPATSTETTVAAQAITAGVGEISDPLAIPESVTITGKVLGTDFTAAMDSTGTKLVITAITTLSNPSSVVYDKMTAAIAGDVEDGCDAIDFVYQYTQYIPSALAAPTWSKTKSVRDALIAKAPLVSNHYEEVVYTDLASSNANGAAAISWKGTNGYSSIYEKTCFTLSSYGGRTYNLSTLALVAKCQTDFANSNIPYVSPSNKPIPVDKLVTDSGDILMSETDANLLNANGITTAIYIGGGFKLWGSHNSNYSYASETNIDLADRLDSSIAMKFYLANYLQANFVSHIDNPIITSRDGNRITTEAGVWLNSLVAQGALAGGEISFLPAVNPTDQLANGDFKFNVTFANSPNAKSIEFIITPDYNMLTTGGAV